MKKCNIDIVEGDNQRFKMEETYITVKAAANVLNIHHSTLRRWADKGRVKTYRHPISKYRLFKLEDLKKIKPVEENHED